MTTYKVWDTLPAGDITDGLIGAKVGFDYTGGRMSGVIARVTQAETLTRLHLGDCTSGCVIRSTVEVMILTPPPVKVIQPDAPKEHGQIVKIEGEEDWIGVLVDPGDYLSVMLVRKGASTWSTWDAVVAFAGDRQIHVSESPRFPDTEPPEKITEWPEDESILHGWQWRDREGDHWDYFEGSWRFRTPSNHWRSGGRIRHFLPLTRVERA